MNFSKKFVDEYCNNIAHITEAFANIETSYAVVVENKKKEVQTTKDLDDIGVDIDNIKYLVREFDLLTMTADRYLRQHNNDLASVVSKLLVAEL